MDYEKKYKDAFAKAREIHRNEDEKRFDMEWLFPELTESEDERIRKELIKETKGSEERLFEVVTNEEFIAWLEKQGEQKPTESPKDYHDIDPHFGIPVDKVKPNLLTVERAKEISPFMRSGFENESADKVEPKKLTQSVAKKSDKVWSDEDENYLQNAENAFEYQNNKNSSTILWLKSLKNRVQHQEWSEEDEVELDNAVYACLNFYGKDSDTADWLKSLKTRIGG